MNRVREMDPFNGRQVKSGKQGMTLFLVFRYFHDELVPDCFEMIKGSSSFLCIVDVAGNHDIKPARPVF